MSSIDPNYDVGELYTRLEQAEDQLDAEQAARRAAEAEVVRLRGALEEIVSPVKALRDRVPPGYQFDGMMACRLAGDPHYLQEIARKALDAADLSGAPGGGEPGETPPNA